MTRPASVHVPPRWHIVSTLDAVPGAGVPIVLASGPGFGDGRHESTRLCLQAIAALAPRDRPFRMLDLGSGSGILSVAGARLGADVDAVEIDPRAVEHAERNVAANGLSGRIHHAGSLEDVMGPFDLAVANILRDVLLELAPPLVARVRHGGTLVLSGLVSTDVPALVARYAVLLGGDRPEIYERGDWRALVWRHRR